VAHADVSILRGRDDVAAELAVLTGQMDDVAIVVCWQLDELNCDTWHYNGRIKRCHVAQSRAATWHPIISGWLLVWLLKFVEAAGFDPRPPLHLYALTKSHVPLGHALVLTIRMQ
jgi:hypothetical protein